MSEKTAKKRGKKANAEVEDAFEPGEVNPGVSSSEAGQGFIAKRLSIFTSEKYRRFWGAAISLFAFYTCVAIISYFFTWKSDQDKVLNGIWWLLNETEVSVDNWLGKFGAIISHAVVYRGFGVASIIWFVLLFITGLKIVFEIKNILLKRAWRTSIFFVTWIAVVLGYFFKGNFVFLGGAMGYQINAWLGSFLGVVGSPFLLLAALGIYFLLNQTPKKLIEPESEAIMPEQESPSETEAPGPNGKTKRNWNEFEAPSTVSILNQPEEAPVEEPVVEVPAPTNEIELEPLPLTQEKKPLAAADSIELIVETPKEEPKTEKFTVVDGDDLPHAVGDFDPTLELSGYQFPPLDLLEERGADRIVVNNEELQQNKDRILETLRNYNIEIDKIKATVGPTVTLYEIIPAPGVRISKIKNLEDDIALSLAALGIRIIAPIPGKGTIGIEVPNQKAETVPMKTILSSEKFQNTNFDLPIALGKTISNDTFIADLAKMPHLLMAGATGQGKSVGLNAILVSLLYKKHPSQIKFVLVDPKKVELTLFNIIERHFLAKLPNSAEPIITDTKKVIHTLNSLCILMDTRYELLKNAGVRNLREYNAKFISRHLNPNEGHHFMPYIVLVIDEFADLIMTAGKEVEMPIARLAQLARAIGIHLIIATQRPSVNIITGTIKANFPARIAFRVSSKIDSRTILDSGGAEQLIGRGDMLLSTGNDLIRIQCAFVDTPEVEKLTEFIGSQRGYPDAYLLPEYLDEDEAGEKEQFDPSERDPMFNEAAKLIVTHQQGSTSLIQRKLKLGYNRAGRIIDQLESAGVVGPFEGSKARQVLFTDLQSLEQFLDNL
jgi:DNA segregation ATPase FtsK/SpoIIIE, S-DNA-T family